MTEGRRRPPLRVKLALIAIGLLFVGLLEIACRLVGIGASGDPFQGFTGESPFVETTMPDGSPGVTIDPLKSPEPFNPVLFARDKPPGTMRVFVLGGSAVHGYPRDQTSAFARWLADRLSLELPGQRFEAINMGAMSYGSTRLVGVARHCLRYDPDLLIIATGNNEYVERRAAAQVEEITWLRRNLERSSLYRGMRNLAMRVRSDESDALARREHAQVIRDVVRRDHALDREVLAEFEKNLSQIFDLSTAAGVPVLISNVPTNFRDWAPQASVTARPLAGEELARWREARHEGDRLLALDRAAEALAAYQTALAIDDGYAELRYLAGRAALAAGDINSAREHLQAARDLDARPIRATRDILSTSARVARDRKAPFVNADAIFRAAAADSIPGNDLFVDYCHPTIDGHRLWAAAIAARMREGGVLAASETWVDAATAVVAAEEAARKLLVDSRAIKAQAAFARGFAAVKEGNRELAIECYTEVIASDPANYDAYYNRALQELALGRIENGIKDCQTAVMMRPDHYQAWGNLGMALLDLGDAQAARDALERALAIEPRYQLALVNLGKAHDTLGESDHAEDAFDRAVKSDPGDARARLARAVFRLNRGDREGGIEDLDSAEQLSPGNTEVARIRSAIGR